MITTKLADVRARWVDLSPPVAAVSVIVLLILIAALIGKIRSTPSVLLQPTPALPIILIATQPAVVPPTAGPPAAQVAALPPNALRRAVVAYDAPGGNVLGAIESGRTYAVLARWGADWLQADIESSGVVWLKADQLLDLPAGLVDLAPPPSPVVVERPVYVAVQAAPTPAPEQVAPPTPALQQLVILDRGAWAAAAATARAGR